MTDPSGPTKEPANLRLLRLLVTILMLVMIGGFLVIVALFVIRFSSDRSSSPPALPDAITLPDGTKAQAFTVGRDWYAVVTEDDTILIFDRASGELRQTIAIDLGN
jgi:uncharacterized protein DUF6476